MGGGRAEVTLTRKRTAECSGPATVDHPAFKAVREWLPTRPGIAAVTSGILTPDRRSCVIGVQPVRVPGVIKVQVVLRDDKTLVQIEVA